MSLALPDVKRQLQDHLQEGLLMIVGTGLSMAEGISGMGDLSVHLKYVMSAHVANNPDPGWNDIVSALDSGDNLEAAMAEKYEVRGLAG